MRLVPLAERHLDATLEWVNDPELMRLLNRTTPVEPAEHQRWFERLRERGDCRYFAVETPDTAQHVGNVWLWNIDAENRRAEVRVVFGTPDGRDRGFGSDALDQMAMLAFDTFQLHRVYAYVLATNPRAKRAFEKAGFLVEGLLKEDRLEGNARVDAWLLARIRTSTPGPGST